MSSEISFPEFAAADSKDTSLEISPQDALFEDEEPSSKPGDSNIYLSDLLPTDFGLLNNFENFQESDYLSIFGTSTGERQSSYSETERNIELFQKELELAKDLKQLVLHYATGSLAPNDPRGWLDQNILSLQNSIGTRLEGTDEDDILTGASGTSSVFAGLAGNDVLIGSSSYDVYSFVTDFRGSGWGQDTIQDAGGNDLISISSTEESAIINLSGKGPFKGVCDSVNNVYWQGVTLENVSAGNENDLIIGSSASNILEGGLGNDTLFGNAGDDYLSGWQGDNILIGGQGNDIFYSYGKDTYYFEKGDGRDFMYEMDASANDVLLLGSSICKEDIVLRALPGQGYIELGFTDSEDSILAAGLHWQGLGLSRIEMADGSYLDAQDINQITQEMLAYCAAQGVDYYTPLEEFKENPEFQNLVQTKWHT